MRIDPDTCRDPDLLAAEVRRLRNALAADDTWLTDAEREAVRYMIAAGKFGQRDEALTEEHAATLRGLLERTK